MSLLAALLILALPATAGTAAKSSSPGQSSSGGFTPAEKAAAATITQEVVRAHTRFLASDLLEGRAPSTRGDRLSLEYVASQMEAMGLTPAAPGGGWIQKVPLVSIAPRVPDTMVFAGPGGRQESLRYRQDFMAFPGVQKPTASLEAAEVVFVGYGIVAPEYGWDDYKDVDVRGKVILMMNNDPEEDPALFAGKTRLWYGRWDYKYEIAGRKGAAAAIIIHTTPSAGYDWNVIQTGWGGERYELPDEGSPRVALKAWTTNDASKKIAALGGQDLDRMRAAAQRRDFRPVPLGVRISFAVQSAIRNVESGNALGQIRGSDPALAKQIVIYTAHHDHFGKKEGAGKAGEDLIFHGARDNASGVAAVLAIARAYTRLPRAPKRTIVFASVTAEEQQLLGSEYLAKHPPVPEADITANINIDELNIWGKTRDVSMIGLGKSSLDVPIRQILAMQGRTVKADPFPDKGHFYRSDQFNFAKVGVPASYFDPGTDFIGKPAGWGEQQIDHYEKQDYHQPSDEYRDSWDLSGAIEDLQLDFYLGLKVANTIAPPRWNRGDEFEHLRPAK
ncbi:MAG: M20/M25/M40 family metallo-hydrolase [Acidobacteria bacterium]|nr:M20/M25/M40 family metallo-hydrolase [Acidobacteriota bacterium]MCA1610337.1 M20/M25/M40 family metallo-hydrolase [Acidobacteriota bacterium]